MLRTLMLICAGLFAIGIAGCTEATPSGAWVLTPVSYNTLEGKSSGKSHTDVTFPMHLVSDTAGGFWGVSGGSWLHIDGEGQTIRRFNTLVDEPSGQVAALSPSELVVVPDVMQADGQGRLLHFDTVAMEWSELYVADSRPRAVAVKGNWVYFVAQDLGAETFVVKQFSLAAPSEIEVVSPEFLATHEVSLDVDAGGNIYVATEVERFVFGPDAKTLSQVEVTSQRPIVAVNALGEAVWTGDTVATESAWVIKDGSREARQIVERHSSCEDANEWHTDFVNRISLTSTEDETTFSFLCFASGLAWLSNDEFIVSVGDEGGAALVRVGRPTS